MEDNRTLQLVYTFFVGILLALFVGAGISTFYPGPQAPKWTSALITYDNEATDEERAKQRAFDQETEKYNQAMKPYNRNVSIITLIAAVSLLGASIALEKKIRIMSDGIMLGGLFTLLYGIGRGFASEDSKYVFVVVSVGLATVLYLGYHKFVKLHTKTKVKA